MFLYNIVTLLCLIFANVAQFLFANLYSDSLDSSLYFFSDNQYYLSACLFFHIQYPYNSWFKFEMCLNCSGVSLGSFTAQYLLS